MSLTALAMPILGQNSVVVVDGYSSGALLAPAIQELGLDAIHVQSTPEPLSAYVKSFRPDDYILHLVNQGNSSMIAGILKCFAPSAVIPGAEPGVELADLLSHALGTPANDLSLSAARRNKHLMGETVRHAGIRAIQQHRSSDLQNILRWTGKLDRWPVVLKPLTSAGTEDVYICRSEREITIAFGKILEKQNKTGKINDAVLIQEYIEGTEYAVNTVSAKGKHRVTDIWEYERHAIEGAGTVYDSDWLLPFEGPVQSALVYYGFQVLDALGLRYGPAHLEMKMTPQGPILIELNARMFGSMLPRLVQKAIGHSQVDLSLLAYLNPDSFLTSPQGYAMQKSAAILDLQSRGEGARMSHQHLEELRALPGVDRAELFFNEGDPLPRTVSSATMIGQIEFLHEDQALLRQTAATIREWERLGYFER